MKLRLTFLFVLLLGLTQAAIVYPPDGSLQVYTDTPTHGLTISVNGHIGIGTLSPTTKLEVLGAVSANAFIGNGAQLTSVSWTSIDGAPELVTPGMIVGTSNIALTSNIAILMNAQGLMGAILVATGNAVMTILSNGNVGIGTATPSTTLEVAGTISANSLIENATVIVGDTTLNSNFKTVLVNASPVTITLPDASTCLGCTFVIKKIDPSVQHVIINPISTDTIDGKDKYTLFMQYEFVSLISQSGGWYVLGNN